MAGTNGKLKNVPEFLREPIEAAQARLENFEDEVQKVVKDLAAKGRASRKELTELVARLSKQDWHIDDVKGRLGKLREHGIERAHELRDQAETFRSDAYHRLQELQARAVSFLGVATREQVEALSKELHKLARRLEKAEKPRKAAARKPTKQAEG